MANIEALITAPMVKQGLLKICGIRVNSWRFVFYFPKE
jgi:hypothetical protein